ncbi:cutinase transcription factor 1 beta [Fusarium oxysporum]|nr:cutinase transcription factor 1 beta [Fusarium oxysporum]
MATEASEGSAASQSPASTSARTVTGKNNKKRASPSNNSEQPQKATKRRAARACVACRARKVRCDVIDGTPCGNCRWDKVECVVQESRRRRKYLPTASIGDQLLPTEAQLRCQTAFCNPIMNTADLRRPSNGSAISTNSIDSPGSFLSNSGHGNHVPHVNYQPSGYRHDVALHNKLHSSDSNAQRSLWSNLMTSPSVLDNLRISQSLSSLREQESTSAELPAFLRPLPTKIAAEDVNYLQIKGALSIPILPLQNALLQAYIEYVHPYIPLMDLNNFLSIINTRDGQNGQTSLFLYQAVMFAASAFIVMKYLREGGYTTRKAACKSFFQKTRLLYDFDYESDRLILIQALLLMTYWYETLNDQKDTWHWMGMAISLAYTIGLHRNPGLTSMTPAKKKLRKRIWWWCCMRDRLIALGMRQPSRIKDEDFDVPMLEESDFEIEALPKDNTVIPASCTLVRNLDMQRELAIMCIAKAQVCVCISHMLKAQYSVFTRDIIKLENTTNSTIMLFPNKQLYNVESINKMDLELIAWAESLPTCCQNRTLTPLDVKDGRTTIAAPTISSQVQGIAQFRVRDATMHITRMASELHQCCLERFLPPTGITVIMPAMIIHLLEMKNPAPQACHRATDGFRQCMQVMEKLREVYAAADYAIGFLDTTLRKTAVDINTNLNPSTLAMIKPVPVEFSAQTPPLKNTPEMTAALQPPTNSQPQPELYSSAAGLTPTVSVGSEEIQFDVGNTDLDSMQGYGEFSWNAVAGTNSDVNQ